MLVLTRKPGQIIMIGDDIRVTVLRISGKQIASGIEAPTDIAVHREEIYDRIQEDKKQGPDPNNK